jgi:sporulation-control protein spo0M
MLRAGAEAAMVGFSEKMRDSLGAEGATLVVTVGDAPVQRGGTLDVTVTVVGGSKPATVDALVVKIVEAVRHWTDATAARVSEEDAGARSDRDKLTAHWTRTTVHEKRVDVGVTVDAGARHEIAVAVAIPSTCGTTSAGCKHDVHVQADIKGQIDPTGGAKFTVA